jgi:hypothetical protein
MMVRINNSAPTYTGGIQYFILKTKPLRERREDVFEILDATLDPDGKIPEDVREQWSKHGTTR